MKKFRQWLEFAAVLAVGSGLIIGAVILPGRAKTALLQDQRDAIEDKVTKLHGEVDRLGAEIKALEFDPWFIERRLRSEVHFLRPGETVVPENKGSAPRRGRAQNSPR